MANAAVDKLKNFGIRHGEKVGVALIAALCLVFVVLAWSRESIDVTPDQITKTANSAQTNLNRDQSEDEIRERLDSEGLIPPSLVDQVVVAQKQQKEGLTKLAFAGPPFTFPEPGAGLIRETPQLISPVDLYVNAGRGALRVFKTDEQGNLVFASPDEKRQRTPGGGGYGMSMDYEGMMGGGYPGMGMMGRDQRKSQASEEERKKQQEADRKRLLATLAGTPKGEVAEQIESRADSGLLPEQTTAGYRWVSIVGKLDHQQMLDNYSKALKSPDAHPHYLRLDLQRRELLSPDGEQWSDWANVDYEFNQEILAYVTNSDEELTPDDVRLEGLVDMLPFLQIGAWQQVHYGPLVDAEKVAPKDTPPMGGMAGMMGGGAMMGSGGMGMMGMDEDAGYSEMMMGMGGGGYPGMMDGGSMMGSGGMGMMGMGMAGGAGTPGNFPKSKAPELMIRSLDFTVTPDTAYQYRVRLVVANPNLRLDNVKPGTDTTSEELYGPWSEATAAVRVPADVTTYVMGPSRTNPNAVRFQVTSFDETTGLTVVQEFEDVNPGQIVGDPRDAFIPNDDGKGTKRSRIDFTSGQLVVDATAGTRPLELLGRTGATFASPALALVMRNDGMLVLRDETHDRHDPEMRQMREVYNKILRDAEEGGKKPKPDSMMGMMGGGMMDEGMMGGGMKSGGRR